MCCLTEVFYVVTYAGRGGGILADHIFHLYQTKWADYAPSIIILPQKFSDLPTSLTLVHRFWQIFVFSRKMPHLIQMVFSICLPGPMTLQKSVQSTHGMAKIKPTTKANVAKSEAPLAVFSHPIWKHHGFCHIRFCSWFDFGHSMC